MQPSFIPEKCGRPKQVVINGGFAVNWEPPLMTWKILFEWKPRASKMFWDIPGTLEGSPSEYK